MIIYLISIFFLLCGTAWLWKDMYDIKQYNKQLFDRSWKLQVFLMEIYPECPPEVQDKIERYLNNISPL